MWRFLLITSTIFTVKLKESPSAEPDNGEETLKFERQEYEIVI